MKFLRSKSWLAFSIYQVFLSVFTYPVLAKTGPGGNTALTLSICPEGMSEKHKTCPPPPRRSNSTIQCLRMEDSTKWAKVCGCLPGGAGIDGVPIKCDEPADKSSFCRYNSLDKDESLVLSRNHTAEEECKGSIVQWDEARCSEYCAGLTWTLNENNTIKLFCCEKEDSTSNSRTSPNNQQIKRTKNSK